MSRLFGVFAFHSPESCPLNNPDSRKKFIGIDEKLQSSLSKHKITKLHGFYMSVLEHQWVLIVEAENAHDIESFCIEVGISSTSTVKIVPLNDFNVVVERVKGSS